MLTEFTNKILEKRLTKEMTSKAFEVIMSGRAQDKDIYIFLKALQENGVNKDHVIGAIDVMREKMIPVDIPLNSMDTCGTGGDGKFSLNISTAVAFVLASYGIPVAKHGNRSITSNCGSADVLKSLDIEIDLIPEELTECINKMGICFMFAPNHHPAMKYVATARNELGKLRIKTIFNMLGPLLNPGNVDKQIVGVFSEEVQNIYKFVFNESQKKAFIIHGHEGMDELSTEGVNVIAQKNEEDFLFDPIELGMKRPIKNELKGDNPDYNASRILSVFSGEKDSFYDIIALNSAVGLILYKNLKLNLENINIYINEAKNLIDNGYALNSINKLKGFSKK